MKRILLLLFALPLFAGCQPAMVKQSVDSKLGGSSPDDQIEFWHTLNDQPITSNDDGMHGLLLYFDNQDTQADYSGRVTQMKKDGLLPSDFHAPANEALQRGIMAYALVKGLHIKGGWVMLVFGPSPRYALRELEFRGLFPHSSPQQPLSGAEFVGIIGRIQDYQTGESGNIPATELPSNSPSANSQ
ncbi:MAG TPA: hypothetical protein VMD30_04380 [Tepidisphaeraceae bacterium]|nr:hypothetical protein [Tepidisphaeraceae bacterium]